MKDMPGEDHSADVLKKTFVALKQAQARVHALEARRAEPIAIVGMACRLPGGANDPEALWALLCRGADACGPIPPERWSSDQFYSAAADAPGRTHAARAHFLDSPVGDFDAPFFSISAKEAAALDPQQRLLLEISWQALEDAGIDPASLRGSRTGVFTGISSDDYAQAHRHSGRLDLIDGYALTGTCFAPAAGRVSYSFGFEGPSIAVDTACSSSLVAVHLACQSLRDGESDLALAAGVNLILSPVFHIASSKLGTISADGLCKTFDAGADGYGRGEGCGVVALKRLADAQAQGDRILAVIRGSAVNQDGRSNGLTAPNGLAQERVIREALGRAGLAPGDIDYIEVHGTGTALGDPIEVEAIGRIMQDQRPPSAPVILSTVKSNIGHLEAAAGVAGLIKAVQCLRHGEIPAHLHLNNPSPHIPWDRYPFKVVTERTPLGAGDQPRRAGVSSFGFSGTNAHLVVEAPPPAPAAAERPAGAYLLPLSARSAEALRALAERWVAWLAAPTGSLADAAATAGAGRSHLPHRLAVVGATAPELASALQSYLDGKPNRQVAVGEAGQAPGKVAALFTGQGSQYVGMGRALYAGEPVFRQVVDACDTALRAPLGRSIRDALYGEQADEDALRQTGWAQPAIFVIELALYRLWESWGVKADVVCGHSIGEYAAAHVAGVLSLADALALVAERGRLMQQQPAGGAMASVFAAESVVRPLLRPETGLAIAAVNAPQEVVISGPQDAVDEALRRLEAAGLSALKLRVSHAFHSSLMRPIVGPFAAFAADRAYGQARLAMVSTVTGRRATGGDLASARYWAEQIEAPVRFAAAVEALAADGADVFLEVGPTPILTGLARASAPAAGLHFLSSLRAGADDRRQLLDSLARLYVRGMDIRWSAVGQAAGGARTAIPGYPFQRKNYYLAPIADAGGAGAAPAQPGETHPYLGQAIRSPALPVSTVLHQALFSADQPRFLREHQIFGKIISPAAAHISMAFAAAGPGRALEDVAFTAPLVVEPGAPRRVQLVLQGDEAPGYRLMSQAADAPGAAPWTTHCTGHIGRPSPAPPAADLDALRRRCPGATTPDVFYQQIEALGYSTGPDFQCLRDIRKGEGESVCRIAAGGAIVADAIHPGLIDSVLQTVLPACEAETAQMLSGGRVLVPLHMAAIQLFGSLDQPLECHTRVEVAGDVVKGQITAYDATGAPVLEIRDFLLKLTDQATLYEQLRQDDGELIHRIAWRPAAADPAPLGDGAHWLLLMDGSGWSEAIAGRLRALGQDVHTLGGDDPLGRDALSALLAARPQHPLHVLFARLGQGDDPIADCERRGADALATIQTLAAMPRQAATRLWMLTRQAQAVVGEDARAAGGLDGPMLHSFGRAVAQEFPDLWGGLIDLEAQPTDAGVDALLQAIDGPAGETEVAIRRGAQRFTPRLARAPREAAAHGLPALGDGEAYVLEKGARKTLDALRFAKRPRQAPAATEVEVEVLAAGLNFRDVLNALGQYPGEAGALGFEAVGRVTRRGGAVTDLQPGDCVIVLAAPGCIASHVTVARALVIKKPAALDVAQAVSLPAAFLTADYALNHLGRMRRGDRVLIHAAAGGVGLAAVQLALAAGAEVFATAGSPEKQAHLRAMGVTQVMSSRNTDFAAQIRAATSGQGVDMVLNSLSGAFIDASFSVLAQHGRFLEMGKIGIWSEAQARARDPSWLYRPFDLAAVARTDPALLMGLFERLLDDVAAGRLTPPPVSVFAMSDAQEAFRFMAQARHIGKIVLSRQGARRRESIEARGLIRRDASYLITGGLGALGLRLARWLVEEGARSLVLAGRAPPNDAAGAVIADLRAMGAQVQALQADVSKADDVKRLLAACETPPLAGIFHAAGLLDDGMIADLDPQTLARIMAPKVAGAWLLHQATRALDLDLFVLFSSIAAVIGNLGQAGYAAANGFMDGLAVDRQRQGLAATSINWGPWAQTGMAAALETDRFTAQGIRALAPARALGAMKRLLTEGAAQGVVADIDWQAFGRSHGLKGDAGLFSELISQGAASVPASADVRPAREIIADLQAALPAEREGVLRRHLQDLARETLGYGETETINPDQPLVDQGFDSLMSVDMRNRLGRSLGQTLPASLLFDYPTLDRIARHLLQAVIPLGEAEAAPGAAERLLEEIEQLTA